jgi:hypothetical protein
MVEVVGLVGFYVASAAVRGVSKRSLAEGVVLPVQ